MIPLLRSAILLCLMVISAAALAQSTVTLQQGLNGYTGSTDAWLWSGAADTNYGAADDWKMQLNTTTATLLRFAIFQAEGGPVPNGATITAATLSVYKYSGATSGTYNARRLLRSWVESQATWNSASSGSPWEGGGAQGPSDVTTLGEAQVTMGAELGWLNYDVLAIAQAWAGGAANHGFRMRQIAGENQPHYFYSKDRTATQAALRPKLTITYTTPSSCTSGPYGGTPWPAPGTIEAEDFDCGGEGAGYHDQTVGNQSTSTYRNPESVDVLDLAGGGRAVQYFDTGEWMKYTINVPTAGNFDLAILAASNWVPAGQVAGQFSIEVGGKSTGTVDVISTGSWDIYAWTSAPTSIFLPAGQHVLKLNSVQLAYRVDRIRLEPGAAPLTCEDAPQRPFTTAIDIPAAGRIFEAENYDCGGEGVAYHDLTPGNQLGSTYRAGESVDVWDIPGGGQVVRNFDTGEWMEYTINVATEGSYRLGIRAGHNDTPGLYRIDVDGNDATGNVTVPSTGSWDVYQWFDSSNTVLLTAGTHVLRLTSAQQHFRVEKLRVVPATGGGGGGTIDQADILARPRADIPFAGQSGYIQVLGHMTMPDGYGASRPLDDVPETGLHSGSTSYGTLRFGKQADPTDSSKQVFAFMVAPGDPITNSGKRAELSGFGENIEFGKVYWAALKVYVYDWGSTAGTNDDGLFGVQVHVGNNAPSGMSPSFGIYEYGGRGFRIPARHGGGKTLYPPESQPPRSIPFGQWTEFVFKFRHGVESNGLLQVWQNNDLIVDHRGSLGYEITGVNDYVKFGYYNWMEPEFDASGQPRKVLLHSPLLIKGFDASSSDKYTVDDVRTFLREQP